MNSRIFYKFPSNVRELKRVCEQVVLTSPLPFVRKEDLYFLIRSEDSLSKELDHLNFKDSLEIFLETQEKKYIENCLKITKSIDNSCEILKISKSNLYKKIKDLAPPLTENNLIDKYKNKIDKLLKGQYNFLGYEGTDVQELINKKPSKEDLEAY